MGRTGAADADALRHAVDRVRGALGPDRVLDRAGAASAIAGRSLNRGTDPVPSVLVRPQSTDECRLAMEHLHGVRVTPQPIASLTTFWEPHPSDTVVGIDTLALRTPQRIDAGERIGIFGAGVSVREIDRLARAQGLCLVAYPDSDGSASIGSMAAVACTAGLGLGRIAPVEQIVGLTVVTPAATVVRTGAMWRRGHGGLAYGEPDPTGIFLGSQGRFGVVTEVVVTLAPAPCLAARSWQNAWRPLPTLAPSLRRAREEIDRGVIDSLRLEAVGAGGAAPRGIEWFVRCWAPDTVEAADAHAAAAAGRLGAQRAHPWVESAAGRRGELPDHDARYALPPGTHHERTGRDGFLGVEVNVTWGTQLDGALRIFDDLLETLGRLAPGHLRLGVYPGAHALSIGVQAMLSGSRATPDAVRDAVAPFVEPLAALGALPYRGGRVWQSVTDRRERDDPACAIVRRAAGTAPAA